MHGASKRLPKLAYLRAAWRTDRSRLWATISFPTATTLILLSTSLSPSSLRGVKSLVYLLAGSLLGGGLHPMAGHLIAGAPCWGEKGMAQLELAGVEAVVFAWGWAAVLGGPPRPRQAVAACRKAQQIQVAHHSSRTPVPPARLN